MPFDCDFICIIHNIVGRPNTAFINELFLYSKPVFDLVYINYFYGINFFFFLNYIRIIKKLHKTRSFLIYY